MAGNRPLQVHACKTGGDHRAKPWAPRAVVPKVSAPSWAFSLQCAGVCCVRVRAAASPSEFGRRWQVRIRCNVHRAVWRARVHSLPLLPVHICAD